MSPFLPLKGRNYQTVTEDAVFSIDLFPKNENKRNDASATYNYSLIVMKLAFFRRFCSEKYFFHLLMLKIELIRKFLRRQISNLSTNRRESSYEQFLMHSMKLQFKRRPIFTRYLLFWSVGPHFIDKCL